MYLQLNFPRAQGVHNLKVKSGDLLRQMHSWEMTTLGHLTKSTVHSTSEVQKIDGSLARWYPFTRACS